MGTRGELPLVIEKPTRRSCQILNLGGLFRLYKLPPHRSIFSLLLPPSLSILKPKLDCHPAILRVWEEHLQPFTGKILNPSYVAIFFYFTHIRAQERSF